MAGLLKQASKRLQRGQELLKQKMEGKHEDMDESYADLTENFNKQQKSAERLQKDLQAYMKALHVLVQANKALCQTMKVVYEPDWADSAAVYESLEGLNLMHADLHDKLEQQVAIPYDAYVKRFPDISARMNKRERKALDFSSAKRNVDSTREKGGPKHAQAEEAFAEAEKTFTEINTEVHDIASSFYQGRVALHASTFQTFFSECANFHQGCAKLHAQLQGVMDQSLDSESGLSMVSKPITTRISSHKGAPAAAVAKAADQPASAPAPSAATTEAHAATGAPAAAAAAAASVTVESSDEDPSFDPAPADPTTTAAPAPAPATIAPASAAPAAVPAAGAGVSTAGGGDVQRRLATHDYKATDEDELGFAKGDVIDILPFPDPELESDGWAYGRVGDREGVFPLNFTGPYTQ